MRRGLPRRILSPLLLLGALQTGAPAQPPEPAAPCQRIEMFSRSGCPHCAAAREYLRRLGDGAADLEVEIRDIEVDRGALDALVALSRELRFGAVSVPTFVVCDEVIVGYDTDEGTGARLAAAIGLSESTGPGASAIDLGRFGVLDLDRVGLPLFTIAVGLVDGFNPCAMWVLLFLLSVLVNLKDRRRILAVAGTFVIVSGLAYFAFMAAWLNVFLLVGFSRAAQVGLGGLALGIGAVHIKDFFAFGRGPSLSIPAAAKPGIYARVRGIVQAENLPAAIAGALVLAVLVNVVELLCTAGLPALYTQILTLQGLERWQSYAYLALYNLAYVFDDALMVGLVVVTLGRQKLDERRGRWLKLVSGTLIALLGAILLFAPEMLTP